MVTSTRPIPTSDMADSHYRYEKKFAILPVEFRHGEWVWLKFYYRKYIYLPTLNLKVYQCAMTAEDATADKLKNI